MLITTAEFLWKNDSFYDLFEYMRERLIVFIKIMFFISCWNQVKITYFLNKWLPSSLYLVKMIKINRFWRSLRFFFLQSNSFTCWAYYYFLLIFLLENVFPIVFAWILVIYSLLSTFLCIMVVCNDCEMWLMVWFSLILLFIHNLVTFRLLLSLFLIIFLFL